MTSPSPVNVAWPIPWKARSGPFTLPVDVSSKIGCIWIWSHAGDNSTTASVIASPSKEPCPFQTNRPVENEGSTVISALIRAWPLEWPASPETFIMVSDSHWDPETLPNIPVIKLTFLTPIVDSVATSCNIPPEPLVNSSRAALISGSPKKAETLILPAGTVNE